MIPRRGRAYNQRLAPGTEPFPERSGAFPPIEIDPERS